MKAKKTPNSRAYTGHSGQMAELLFRECNVAIPEVDVGTDVFAFVDDSEEVARIQVKTAQGKRYKDQEGYRAQFTVPAKQLKRNDNPPLYYVFAVRVDEKWADFLVISRFELNAFWTDTMLAGSENWKSRNVVLTVQFYEGNVRCGEVDLTDFRNAWNLLPTFRQSTVAPQP